MNRVAAAALLSCLALGTLVGCDEDQETSSLDDFVGTWVNQDSLTSHITRVEVEEEASALAVRMWGQCHPDDCPWGVERTDKADADDGELEITWNQFPTLRTQRLVSRPDGGLEVFTNTHYQNGSDPDQNFTEIFRRE